ncbi:MAG TPA: hypothetical protein VEG27_09330, partial [Usitatibacter sp.]|nr:hypothetical protein [Usitatibacter sp.]
MARSVIALNEVHATLPIPTVGRASEAGVPADARGRALRDLRISVTDRCNFRCRYCMPREVFGPDYQFLPRENIMRFEEIARVARIFAR